MKYALISAVAAALALSACNKAAAPGAGAGAAQLSGTQLSPNTVVATWDGKKVTLGELDAQISKDMYDLRHQALETMILRQLVEGEAKKEGKSEEELLRGVAEKATPPADDAKLHQLYEQNKEAFGGASFEDVKPMLQARLNQQVQQQAVVAYLDQLKQKANVKITLPEPRAQVAAEGPSKGPADAPVTIVEFSDFQCPYCAKARQTVDQVMASYAGKVRLVFRQFPLPFHDKAPKAAEAALCANEQGKFWEMHDRLFEGQDKLGADDLKATAKALGLDAAKFDSCLGSDKFAAQVQADTKAGKEAGVTGTPAFFINGRMLSGAQPYEKFREVVEEELQRGH